MIPTISTTRLTLRAWRIEDLPDVQRYATRPEFWRFLPIPEQTLESVAEFLARRLDPADPPINLALSLSWRDQVIGSIRLGLGKGGQGQADVGYALDTEFQHQGLMTEALQAILAYGFDNLGLHRVWATAEAGNTRSWHLLERFGMRREGHMRRDRLVRGRWRDSFLYAMLAEDWSARQADDLEDLVSKITEENRHPEVQTRKAVGNEFA